MAVNFSTAMGKLVWTGSECRNIYMKHTVRLWANGFEI